MRIFRSPLASCLVALTLFAASGEAASHHSLAGQFDVNKEVTIRGTILKMQWQNPHGWLHVAATDASGQSTKWMIEFASANSLYRWGWRNEDLPVGQAVTVVGLAARDGSQTLAAKRVVLADGKTLFADGGKPKQ